MTATDIDQTATEAPAELTLSAAARFYSMSEPELTQLSRRGVLPPIKRGKLPWVETTQCLIAYLRDPHVTAEEAGQLIGKSASWIRKLLGANYVQRRPDGVIARDSVWKGYVAFLTGEGRNTSRVAAENRVRDARTREIELRTQLRSRELCRTEEAVEALEEVAGFVRSEFSGLPARVTRDLPLRRMIDKEIANSFNRVADRLEAEAEVLRSGERAAAKPGRPDGSDELNQDDQSNEDATA
jgi:hypothetical protein